jgi:hypothetical protein
VGNDTFLAFLRRAVNEKWWNVPKKKDAGIPKLGTALPSVITIGGGSAHE